MYQRMYESTSYWTGAREVNGVYRWVGNNAVLPLSSSNWSPHVNNSPSNGKCVALYKTGNNYAGIPAQLGQSDVGKLYAEDCNKPLQVMCFAH